MRGFSASSPFVIDEAARGPDLLYQALRPMLVVGRGDLTVVAEGLELKGLAFQLKGGNL